MATKKLSLQKFIGILIIILITIAGVRLITLSHAQSPDVAINADSGKLSGPTSVQNDSRTLDGRYVQFGNNTFGIQIVNGRLENYNQTPIRLLGVDLSHTGNACIMGVGISTGSVGTPTQDNATAQAMKSWGINAVRIPLNEDCWLDINNSPAAYSGVNYQNAIKDIVNSLNSAGIYTILDLHFSAPGSYIANQQWPMADADHSPTFWTQVATAYKSDPAVLFDLFNEPFIGQASPSSADWSCWLNGCNTTFSGTINGVSGSQVSYNTVGMQQLVNTVRATGARQPIMIGGLHWAGDPCGLDNSGGNGGGCSEIINKPSDPLNQLAISLHVYGPTHNTPCSYSSCWPVVLSAAKSAGLPIITGELGEQNCGDDSWFKSYLNWSNQNGLSYLAWGWDTVDQSTACSDFVSSANPGSGTLQLLSNWTGSPSSLSPQADDYKSNLLSQNP